MRLALVMVLAALAVSKTHAADLEVTVSTREAYLGESIQLSVKIINARSHELPRLPDIPGAIVREMGGPSRLTSNVNGVVTRSVTYTYVVIPGEAGVLRIPPVTVLADARELRSKPVNVIVVEAEQGEGDLMFAQIEHGRETVFVGEPLELTLNVWIRPYRDRRHQVTVGEEGMWGRIDRDLSQFGPFADVVNSRRRMPRVREVLRDNGDGESRSYYLYTVSAKVWPDKAGPLDLGDVTVTISYPLSLRRERDFFRSNLTVDRARAVQVVVDSPPVMVKEVPIEGRPQWYAGAVGRFDIRARAQPTEVAVGDPITVTIDIRDLAGTAGRLEVLKPPPLFRITDLTERFRMPVEPLAGVVDRNRKRFEQTLRAVDDTVDEIPPIPFAFFDPQRETFVTVATDPIPVTVHPASMLSMSDVVGGNTTGSAGTTDLTEVEGGLLANYNDPMTLLVGEQFRLAWWHAVLFGLPPVAWLVTTVTTRRLSRLRTDRGFARGRVARRNAMRGIAEAGRSDPGRQAELVAAAVRGYVADRCDLPAGAVTRAEVVQWLEKGDVRRELIDELEQLLQECEQHQYAGATAANGADLATRASQSITRLEREL